MAALTPMEAMQMAIEEGRKGQGFVSPNPLVGCVIVDRDQRFLSTGYHAKVGSDHAEAAALKAISDQSLLQDATVYVTLEPCAHEGRTPSCAKALAQLPIKKVVYGLMDPNPLVSGQGVEILRAAGKEVEQFHGLRDELEELAEIFLTNMRERRVFVGLKVASSLDGRIALLNGESQWITGEPARALVHEWRGSYDAVLTGAGTLLRDNPRLNSRDGRFRDKPSTLIVLDPEGGIASRWTELKAAEVRRPEDVLVVVKKGAGQGAKVPVLEASMHGEHFDLQQILAALFQRGLRSLFVEAGGFTASSFLREKLADRLYLFLAPKILGQGLSWSEGLRISAIDKALTFEKPAVRWLGEDLLWTARIRRSSP